jgi:hypothetical protein
MFSAEFLLEEEFDENLMHLKCCNCLIFNVSKIFVLIFFEEEK